MRALVLLLVACASHPPAAPRVKGRPPKAPEISVQDRWDRAAFAHADLVAFVTVRNVTLLGPRTWPAERVDAETSRVLRGFLTPKELELQGSAIRDAKPGSRWIVAALRQDWTRRASVLAALPDTPEGRKR